MARSRSRATWSYVPRHRFRPELRVQAHMIRRMQPLVARGWAAAPRHPGMRPPEATPGIIKLRSEQDSCRAAIFLAALIFFRGYRGQSQSKLANTTSKEVLHAQRPLR